MTTRKWGVETPVNTTTAGPQVLPATATLADGGYVVTWLDTSGNDSLAFQIYNADGTKRGQEVIRTTSAGEFGPPSIATFDDGNFAVGSFFLNSSTSVGSLDSRL